MMLELILRVDWALFMHEEKENHLEQVVFPNDQNEPSLISSICATGQENNT